jgi:DMSO/TMAO reductase YedYZ molybdopterin-dependent catalytic subunit
MRVVRVATRLIFLVAVVSEIATSRADQQPPAPAGSEKIVLRVGGEVPRPLTLTAAEFARLPRTSVRIKESSGNETGYEGTPLIEVLKAAGVKFGEDLRGPALATYLVVEASDGYRAVFALPELDPAFNDRMILLADRRDGQPLGGNEGPLRIVIPTEKRHSRWVRLVTGLTVQRAPASTASTKAGR